jgi:HTH-type transcriptional regulator, sugar sensing transcriptional regulator
MNEQLLEEIGLTKGEIKVYLTLLKIGETTTGKIIDQAQISSGKIYEILEKLMKKGLVSYIIKEKTKHFSAASPNRIMDFLAEKEKELKKKQDELEKELPSLLAYEKAIKPEYETRLFKGTKGVQTAIFEALESLTFQDEILGMGLMSIKQKQFNIIWQRWHNERINRKIKCKALFSDKKAEIYRNFIKMNLTEIRILEGLTPSALSILKNFVLIFTYGEEPSCLSIRNPEIAQSYRAFFYNLWNYAK